MTDTFNGFVIPEKNYFPMPNEWIEICASIDNLAELKVIQYVLRHTWGFQEFGVTKAITVEEFMHGRKRTDGTRIDSGTGLKSDRSVKDGLKAAVKHGYLVYDVDATDLARIKKSYALKMVPAEGYNLPPDVRQVVSTPLNDENRQVVSTPLAGSIYPPEGYNLPPHRVVSTPRSEKHTKETHLKKHTKDKYDSCASPIVDAEPSAFSDDDEPTVKAPAIPKTPITITPAQDIPPVRVETVPEQAAPGNDENETQYPQQQTLVAPAASKSRARQAKKVVEPELTPDELALQARCSKWYDRLTDWCGGPMTKGGQVINEHKSIKLACQKYSDAQLEAIFKYVTTRDWKYSKIDNKYTVRCYVLWDESGRVAQILKEERQSGQCSQPANNAPRFAANMPANLGNEPLVVWKPPTKTKQPVTARGR